MYVCDDGAGSEVGCLTACDGDGAWLAECPGDVTTTGVYVCVGVRGGVADE